MISLADIDFSYTRGKPIFNSFSLEVRAKESWAVSGASGTGKTTLLHLIAGLCRPQRGELRILGEKIKRPRPGTGLVLQDYGLLPWMTCRENIALGLQIERFYRNDGIHARKTIKLGKTEIQRKVDYWIEQLGLSECAIRFPEEVSGGQRQRTALARTLALDPDLLLLDEPFSSLDIRTCGELSSLLSRLQRELGLTQILVTHEIERACQHATKILILAGKRTCVIENPNAFNLDYGNTEEYKEKVKQIKEYLKGAE